MPLRQLADGTIVNGAGKVLHFSLERFVNDICLGDRCFVCGRTRRKTKFNDEHVLPNWLLKKFKLHSASITLPNLRGYRYGQYTISCCKRCNARMGRELEAPISKLVGRGFDAVVAYLRKHGTLRFFVWFALIFLKTHLKDRTLRLHQDQRKGDAKIAELYEWEDLYFVHCLARSFYTRPYLASEIFGSLVLVPAKVSDAWDSFDYGDLYGAQAAMLRIDDMCFIVVLNDSCGALSLCSGIIRRIKGPMSPLQLRELFAHIAYANMKLKVRPQFAYEIDRRGRFRLTAEHPSTVEMETPSLDEFGRVFSATTDVLLAKLANPNLDEIRKQVRQGRRSFLFDEHGDFIVDSMRPASLPR